MQTWMSSLWLVITHTQLSYNGIGMEVMLHKIYGHAEESADTEKERKPSTLITEE